MNLIQLMNLIQWMNEFDTMNEKMNLIRGQFSQKTSKRLPHLFLLLGFPLITSCMSNQWKENLFQWIGKSSFLCCWRGRVAGKSCNETHPFMANYTSHKEQNYGSHNCKRGRDRAIRETFSKARKEGWSETNNLKLSLKHGKRLKVRQTILNYL